MVAQGRDEATEARALIDAWIEPDPYRPGAGDVRLREYGVHVWALIGHMPSARWNAEEVARAYAIPVDAARAAHAYYARHTAVIEARIDANVA
jgi:hypothetical protein